MEDSKIIQLFWDRSSNAIPETAAKYEKYCTKIAVNILGNREDAEECVNDTFFNAWNAIPPYRPAMLSAFLGKITRNLAFNKYKRDHAEKRGSGETAAVLDEIAEIVSGTENVEAEIDKKELVEAINDFLGTLGAEKRKIFVCRYWCFDSVSDLSRSFGKTQNNISVILNRLRRDLRDHLKERGYDL